MKRKIKKTKLIACFLHSFILYIVQKLHKISIKTNQKNKIKKLVSTNNNKYKKTGHIFVGITNPFIILYKKFTN